ncbi:MAG: hypothetical protein K0S65_3603 [Labilithrix sp.]|nr:hypothetical protein [Labilithrix sp.]
MNDEELRRHFEDLRRSDRRRAPDFHEMLRAARPSRSRWRFVVPAASLATAAMLVVWCGARMTLLGTPAPQAAAPATLAAAAATPAFATRVEPTPLDFLLETAASTPAAVSASGLDSNPLDGW